VSLVDAFVSRIYMKTCASVLDFGYILRRLLSYIYIKLLVYCVLFSFEGSCYGIQFFAYDLYVVDVA
jgi:hypothetical protein